MGEVRFAHDVDQAVVFFFNLIIPDAGVFGLCFVVDRFVLKGEWPLCLVGMAYELDSEPAVFFCIVSFDNHDEFSILIDDGGVDGDVFELLTIGNDHGFGGADEWAVWGIGGGHSDTLSVADDVLAVFFHPDIGRVGVLGGGFEVVAESVSDVVDVNFSMGDADGGVVGVDDIPAFEVTGFDGDPNGFEWAFGLVCHGVGDFAVGHPSGLAGFFRPSGIVSVVFTIGPLDDRHAPAEVIRVRQHVGSELFFEEVLFGFSGKGGFFRDCQACESSEDKGDGQQFHRDHWVMYSW